MCFPSIAYICNVLYLKGKAFNMYRFTQLQVVKEN